MTLQDLGALGEVVGGVFTIATLIYLAIQLRYLRSQAEMQASFNRSQSGRDVLLGLANSDYLPQIINKMRNGSEEESLEPELIKQFKNDFGIDREEIHRLFYFFYAWLKNHEASFGNVREEEQQSIDRLIIGFATTPGFRLWWPSARESFNTSFAKHVDVLLGDT